MTLVDAGPIIALVYEADYNHDCCASALGSLQVPLLTSWAVFGEAMHVAGVLGKKTGSGGKWLAQDAVWRLLDTGAITVAEPTSHLASRMRGLMAKYRDTPMDLGDASLVALAEDRAIRRIFTLDSDFTIYRAGKHPFEIVPEI